MDGVVYSGWMCVCEPATLPRASLLPAATPTELHKWSNSRNNIKISMSEIRSEVKKEQNVKKSIKCG
ncbi:hypothetical protein K1T71_005944 [Dendrolimus kikuchii]|uniref:Uncharacterized protein n=1 Tax=Dendrolimus kikuchii TaxID=765133 RepID=A0ACC1D2Q0_9NEOP|nr:hypothetical protein K1T71_005944 [Dendrolimus kikuchii]